jgi:eukaryotic translation initiation factor 2-alpha kinase 3
MSMFRSGNDDSVSDPQSSSDEHDTHLSDGDTLQTSPAPRRYARAAARASLRREETASESFPANDDFQDATDWIPNTAEQHATLLTSSLLEFAYTVKAAEHLNHAQGTKRFHRESPEARALGARMYQGASQVLAANGIVADCVHEESWREMRQRYIIGVDNLGLQAFNENVSRQGNSPRGRKRQQDSNMLVRRTSRPRQEMLNVINSTYLPGRLAPISQHRELTDAMIRRLAIPSLQAPIRLSPAPLITGGNRYNSEFWELKPLGKGGFGTVYHVKNFVDNQDYAVKKIPLKPSRLRKWQTNGAKEVEALLKEIRTLARLEHSNIVRYYAGWIEGGEGSREATCTGEIPHQLYLGDKPASSNGSSHSRYDVPEHSVDSGDGGDHDSMGIVFGEDSDSSSQTHDVSPRGLEALGDGLQLHQADNNQPSFVTSVSNETDIFTDGEVEIRPGVLKREETAGQTTMVLHIQMSLHPLSLSTYLAHSESLGSKELRHCFHMGPSLRLISAIISGVEYLHSQGIVHRDIKPGNIFLSEHWEYDQRPGCVDISCHDCKKSNIKRYLNPRIGDFGLVADISGLHDEPATDISDFSSKAVGTEFYRPPPPSRQNSSDAINEKLDVFALGILLFELLWKMNTKMERHMLLTNLSKKSTLPEDFASKIDPSRRDCPIEGAGQHGSDPTTVGECIKECILNMVCQSPAQRWDCNRVRERLDAVLSALQR